MTDIDNISVIKKEKLDDKNYFKTLIDEAYNMQIINDEDMLKIQVQLIELLDRITYKYNGLESSSIRKEILENISSSNIYTIGVYLKTFRNPDDALKEILQKGIEEVYSAGRKKIDKLLNRIRVVYIKVKQNMINTENEIYNDTILKGIEGFFKIYNPDFKAYDMKITADYPLYNNLIGKLEGIEFIAEYLNSIYIENSFCKNFSDEKIKYLLYGYSSNYKVLIINIFEIVLLETFACKLANRDRKELTITKSDLNKIYEILKNNDSIIDEIYNEIKEELLINAELQEYIDKNYESLKAQIIFASKNETLDKIFIVQKFVEI